MISLQRGTFTLRNAGQTDPKVPGLRNSTEVFPSQRAGRLSAQPPVTKTESTPSGTLLGTLFDFACYANRIYKQSATEIQSVPSPC